jgi:Protein of unknown function (DUF1254)
MSGSKSALAVARRGFLRVASATLTGAGIGCNRNSSSGASRMAPGEALGAMPDVLVKAPKEIRGAAPGTALPKEYVQMVGRFAYFWGWPMVNSFNRRTAMTSAPEPGLRGGILPNAPLGQICMLTDYISADQRFVTCSNQDVAYGMGFGSLDDQPVIMQVPDFGERFWVSPRGMPEPTRSRNWASNTEPNQASTSWLDQTGAGIRPMG